jgi:hypothetical protein
MADIDDMENEGETAEAPAAGDEEEVRSLCPPAIRALTVRAASRTTRRSRSTTRRACRSGGTESRSRTGCGSCTG